jgi:hypothetical protein
MRFLLMIFDEATARADVPPAEMDAVMAQHSRLTQDLKAQGKWIGCERLRPAVEAVTVREGNGGHVVTDGPFAETKELIAGYWIWKVTSMDEAVEWVKRCPNPHPSDSDIEIRPVYEMEDFGAEFTPEQREQEERLRRQLP